MEHTHPPLSVDEVYFEVYSLKKSFHLEYFDDACDDNMEVDEHSQLVLEQTFFYDCSNYVFPGVKEMVHRMFGRLRSSAEQEEEVKRTVGRVFQRVRRFWKYEEKIRETLAGREVEEISISPVAKVKEEVVGSGLYAMLNSQTHEFYLPMCDRFMRKYKACVSDIWWKRQYMTNAEWREFGTYEYDLGGGFWILAESLILAFKIPSPVRTKNKKPIKRGPGRKRAFGPRKKSNVRSKMEHIAAKYNQGLSSSDAVRSGRARIVRKARAKRLRISERHERILAARARRIAVEKPVFKRAPLQMGRVRSTAITTRFRRLANSFARPMCVTYQSGIEPANVNTERAQKRAERDRVQRKAAQNNEKRDFKQLSKVVRRRLVLAARDKRNPVYQMGIPNPVGKIKTVVSAAAAITLGTLGFRVKRKVGNIIDQAGVFLDCVKDFANKIKKALGGLLWQVPFVLCVWYVYSRLGFSTPLIGAAISAVVAKLVGNELWNHVSKFFRGGDGGSRCDPQPEYQSGLTTVAAELLTVLVTFSCVRRKFDARTVTELTKRVALFDRTKGGFESFVDWMFKGVESILNAIRSLFGRDKVVLFKKYHGPTEEWLGKVDRLVCAHNTAAVDVNSDEINNIVDLMRRGVELKEVYRGTPMGRVVEEANIKLTNILMPYLGSINARNNFRQEPIMVCLQGAPGIGKTILSTAFASSVLVNSGIVKPDNPDDVIANMWQKGTSEFWNSYCNQACVIVDDAFQQRVTLQNMDNDFINIIRMVNSWAFPLNMADLPSKGKMFFGSKLILANTNLASIQAEANLVLQEPEAVGRRITYGYKLVLNPVYALPSGRLNMAAYKRELAACADKTGLEGYPWYIWTVRKHDFITGVTDGAQVPMSELLQNVIDDMIARNTSFRDTEAQLKDYISRLKPVYQSGMGEGVDFSDSDSDDEPNVDVVPVDRAVDSAAPPEALVDSGDERFLTSFRKEQRLYASFSKYVIPKVKHILMSSWFSKVAIVASLMFVLHSSLKAVCGMLGIVPSRNKSRPISIDWQSNRGDYVKKPRDKAVPTFQSVDTTLTNLVFANTYKISFSYNGAVTAAGQIMFVEDKLAVYPAHFTRTFKKFLDDGRLSPSSALTFTHVMQPEYNFTYSMGKFLSLRRWTLEGHDVEFAVMSDSRAHRCITKNFLREAELESVQGKSLIMTLAELDKGDMKARPRYWTLPRVSVKRDLHLNGVNLERFVEYMVSSYNGDCGAPLCLYDASCYSGRACLGFHSAGDSRVGIGYGTIVSYEMIQRAKLELDTLTDNFEQDLRSRGVQFQSCDFLPFETKGSFLPVAKVEIPNHLARKTKLCPLDEMFGLFGECIDQPAHLSPVYIEGVKVYPMLKALEPYSSPVFVIENEALIKQSLHVAMGPLVGKTSHATRRVFTFEEACCGVPTEKFRSLPRGTSAGYPYTQSVRDGKKLFFGYGDTFDLDNELCAELRARVEYILGQAKDGVRLSHVFADFLKDELRSPAKNAAVMTRLISSAPLDYTIAFRMMFGAFAAAMMSNNVESGMAPGVCVYTDWYRVANFLAQKGKKVFDGDFKSFDASEQPGVGDQILKFINDWYDDGDENRRVRKVLWEELVHSRHIGGNGEDQSYIYQWNKSLPSGHPFTTCFNSIYSLTVLVAAYIHITGDLSGFWQNVHALTYGDDNVVNPSDKVVGIYNQVTVARAIKELFNMVYTPGRKDGVWTEYATIFDVTFLKRGFVLEDNQWLCPLELNSALFASYWCKDRRRKKEIMFQNLEFTLRELAHHSEDIWNKYVPLIKPIYKRHSMSSLAPFERDAYRFLTLNDPDQWF